MQDFFWNSPSRQPQQECTPSTLRTVKLLEDHIKKMDETFDTLNDAWASGDASGFGAELGSWCEVTILIRNPQYANHC